MPPRTSFRIDLLFVADEVLLCARVYIHLTTPWITTRNRLLSLNTYFVTRVLVAVQIEPNAYADNRLVRVWRLSDLSDYSAALSSSVSISGLAEAIFSLLHLVRFSRISAPVGVFLSSLDLPLSRVSCRRQFWQFLPGQMDFVLVVHFTPARHSVPKPDKNPYYES